MEVHQTYVPWKHFNSHWLPYIPYSVTQKKTLSFAVFSGHKFQIANTNTPILRLTASTGRLHCQNQSPTVREMWSRGLRRRFAAARLLRLWVRIPPDTWMFVCCQCCVLTGRGLCDEPITRPEESYRLWCVVVCDLETSSMRRSCPTGGCCAKKTNKQTNC